MIIAVTVAITAVGTAFRLERGLQLQKLRSGAMEHLLDHMIGPNAKNLIANFSRQMPISQVPGEAHELVGIPMPDFDDRLSGGFDLQQPAVFKLQGISIGHSNRFWKIEKDIFALIRRQANAAAMTSIEVEREGACRAFLRPMSGRTMN
jgi:hypothetical protein